MSDFRNELKIMPLQEALTLLRSHGKKQNDFNLLFTRLDMVMGQKMRGAMTAEAFQVEYTRTQEGMYYFLDKMADTEIDSLKRIYYGENIEGMPKILFCASSPGDLNIADEYFDLSIQINKDNRKYELRQIKNTTPRSFVEETIEQKPALIHFSGHGLKTDETKRKIAEELDIPFEDLGGIVMHQNEGGGTKVLNSEMLSVMFAQFKKHVPNLKCVILNACFAEPQAIEISKYGFYAVGYSEEVKDSAAIEFTSGFYYALHQGLSIKDAVGIGIARAITRDTNFENIIRVYLGGEKIDINGNGS